MAHLLDDAYLKPYEPAIRGRAAQAAARYAAINVLSASEPELANGATMRAVANLTVGNAEDATVQVNKSVGSVSVTVTRPVKCLTFVAGTVFGEAYVSTATSVASY